MTVTYSVGVILAGEIVKDLSPDEVLSCVAAGFAFDDLTSLPSISTLTLGDYREYSFEFVDDQCSFLSYGRLIGVHPQELFRRAFYAGYSRRLELQITDAKAAAIERGLL